MSSILPDALEELIEQFSRIPGVGPRTAERYSLSVLKGGTDRAQLLSQAIERLHGNLKVCPKTFALIDASQTISPLYEDENRDKKTVAVVEDPIDIVAIEKTGQFSGTYHVLGGLISPIDGIGPEQLHVNELVNRIRDDGVAELIIALNASVEGEGTALLINDLIQDKGLDVKISRLARGLPVGVDLEYADQITLKHALDGRTQI